MQKKPSSKLSKRHSWKQFQKLTFDSKKIRRQAARVESATARHAHRFIIKRLNNIRYISRHVLVWFFTVGAILAAVAVQFLISNQGFSSMEPVAEGTYAEGVLGTIDSLNPLQASTSTEVAASRLMFSSLYRYDTTGSLKGDLAKSLSINKSGEVYIVKIREDVKWHDGVPLTIDDVIFTIQLINNPETRSRSSLRTNWQDITVEKLNKFTVKFTLPAYAAFPHALTFPIVPKHILKDIPAAGIPESSFASAPVGSGPFVFRLLQNADIATNHRTVHMTANRSYYKSLPKINRFELHAYPSAETLQKALLSRAITAAADVPQSIVEKIDKRIYRNQSFPLNNGVYLLFNTTNPILRERKVRQALQRTVDPEAVRRATGEQLPSLDLPFIPVGFGDYKLPKVPNRSGEEAARLLDAAGWKLGNDGVRKKKSQTLSLTLTTIKSEQFMKAAEELASQIRQVGIKVDVSIIDDRAPGSNFRQDVLQQRNYEMLVYELPIGADPDVYAYWHSSQLGVSGYNFTNYSSSVSDAALASARDRTETVLRHAKYGTFARQWIADAPAIGLYRQVSSYVYNHNATAIPKGSELVMASDRYATVSTWTVNQGSVYKTP